jgi:hypothetical protein
VVDAARRPNTAATGDDDTDPVNSATPPTELPPMRLARGMRISVYRIESVVGEGGMWVVYEHGTKRWGVPWH